MRRLLITASRRWTDSRAIAEAIEAWIAANCPDVPRHEIVIVHGGARGGDEIAGRYARKHGLAEERVPADWDAHGKKAGVLRNVEMVKRGADGCLGAPLGEGWSGTRHCMGVATRAGIPVVEVKPR